MHFRLFLILILMVLPHFLLAEEPYRFAVTDIVGLEELQREFGALEKFIQEKSGLNIELYPVTNRTAVVEALKGKRLDFALSGPAEYVVARKKVQVIPVIGLSRPGYYSIIAVKKDSGIKSLEDLKGKKIVFGDFGSTSYHLAPAQLLKDGGLDPEKDLEAINISKQVAWKTFLRGNVDAIGMGHRRFVEYSDAEPDYSIESFRVLAKSPVLPDDVILAGPHVPAEDVEKLREVFARHGKEALKAILAGQRNQKYEEMEFLTSVKDSDYDYVRKLYASAGYPEFAS